MAEAKMNAELRIRRMIQPVLNTITCRCADLPDDWLEMDFVSVSNMNAEGQAQRMNPNGWMPVRYMPRDEFFNLSDWRTRKFYTIEGSTITFGGSPQALEGRPFQAYYFAEVPVFSDTQDSWVYTKYPSLYLSAAVMHASSHAVGEEDKVALAKQWTEDTIGKLNAEYRFSKASGSRLARSKSRSFG